MSFRAASVFLATCLLALPAFAESTAAPNDDPRVTRFLQQLEADRAALGIPGLSIAIRADGQPLYLGGRGFADVGKQVPADADTAYPVAGLTESFVAVLAHRLVKQRRLDLDAPVSKWIPAVTDDRVRVKHLLSHTSGGVPGMYFSHDPQRFEFLKKIVEAAGGQSLRAQVFEEIVEPLRLRDTMPGADIVDDADRWDATFGDKAVDHWRGTVARLAMPYTLYGDGEVLRTSFPPTGFGAATGLVSTARDLAAFDAALDGGRLLDADARTRAWTPFVSTAGAPLPMGLGWYATDYRGERLVWQAGHAGTGFSALHLKVPARGLSLVLLANSEALADHRFQVGADVSHDRFACAFLDAFIPDVANKPAAAALATDLPAAITAVPSADCAHTSRVALERWQAARKAAARAIVPIDAALAASVAGRYGFPGREVTFTDEGGRLFADYPDGVRSEVFATGPDTLFFKVKPWAMTVVRDGDRVARLEIGEGGGAYRAERVD